MLDEGKNIDGVVGTACVKAGFQVYRNRVDNRNKSVTKVEFKCKRGRIRDKNSKSTSRPQVKEDLCPFLLSVYFHKELKRWFIPKKSCGNPVVHGTLQSR